MTTDNLPIIVRFLTRHGMQEFTRLYRSIRIEGDRALTGKEVVVHYGERTRAMGYMDFPGLGRVRQSEVIGKNKKRLRITLGNDAVVADNPAQLKDKVRRIRPEELAELTALEEEIDEQSRKLNELKRLRLNFLHDAFQKGHVVSWKEMEEKIK